MSEPDITQINCMARITTPICALLLSHRFTTLGQIEQGLGNPFNGWLIIKENILDKILI
jgi:hypothetical protein